MLRSSAPLSLTDIAARLGATTAPPVRWGGNDLESLDRFNDPEQVCSYLVAELGPRLWTVLEYNDFQGTRPEVQRTLSAGVEQLTLFNGPHSAKLVLVRDGEVQVSLEPQFPWPLDRHGAAPGVLDAVLEELVAVADADADEDWRAPAVRAVERHTGVRFDDAWWKGPHWLVRAPEIPEGPPPEPVGLEAALGAVSQLTRNRVLLLAVRETLRATGLGEDPVVAGALAVAERCAELAGDRSAGAITDAALERLIPVSIDLYDEFSAGGSDRDVLKHGRGRPGAPPMEQDPVWLRMQSAMALEGLLRYLPDGDVDFHFPPPLDFLCHLGYALQDQWPELESRLVRQLTT